MVGNENPAACGAPGRPHRSPKGTAAEAIPQASSTPPSSSLIMVAGPVRGRVKGVPWLLRWFLRERILAAGAQAIVPAIPAPELLVTAQTRDASSILGVFRSPAMVGLAGSFSTHGGPQRCAAGVDGARTQHGSPPCVTTAPMRPGGRAVLPPSGVGRDHASPR